MRLWRNWQTRKTKDLVGDRAGSTPVNRTKGTPKGVPFDVRRDRS